MNLGRNTSMTAGLVACAIALAPRSALAGDDPWLGRDKALHFAATLGLAAGGYAGCALADVERPWRLGCGLAIGMGAGIAKEVADLAGLGDPSWRDLAWDGLGTAAGLLLAWGIDRLLADERSPEEERPEPGETVTTSEALTVLRELEGRAVPLFATLGRPQGAAADGCSRLSTDRPTLRGSK